MPNIRGKAYAINVLTPMKRWKAPFMRAAFMLFGIRATQWELRALSFIHFARWTIVRARELPHFPGMLAREGFAYDYLLFESNFNGSWNEYIDAFHAVLHFKLNLVWLSSENFPGPIPLMPFKAYINRNQVYTDYYYMAYPGSTVSDVKNARAVLAAFGALAREAEAPDAAFAQAYRGFLSEAQNKLGANGGPGPAMT